MCTLDLHQDRWHWPWTV